MQAIVTKYHGPTNTRASRYSASTESGQRISVPADYALDARDNHERAARALMRKLGWTGKIAGGGVKGGYVWVFAEGARDPGSRHRHRRAGAPTFAQQAAVARKMRLLERENERRRPRRSQAQMLAIAYRYAGVAPRPTTRRRSR